MARLPPHRLARRSREDTTAVLTTQRAHPSDQHPPRSHKLQTAAYQANNE